MFIPKNYPSQKKYPSSARLARYIFHVGVPNRGESTLVGVQEVLDPLQCCGIYSEGAPWPCLKHLTINCQHKKVTNINVYGLVNLHSESFQWQPKVVNVIKK